MDIVYADNNATTAVAPEVVEAMMPYLTGEYFNPSSMYERARGTAEALEASRRTVARTLGTRDPSQIVALPTTSRYFLPRDREAIPYHFIMCNSSWAVANGCTLFLGSYS